MGAWHLLDPKGLLLLAGAVPLVVLYVLRVKRRRERVSSTWLWAAAQRDLLARHPFRRLVAELPLLLQLLAVVALAFALARPSRRGAVIEGDHVAIVVDTSASMATRVGGPPERRTTRMDEARRAASDVVGRLGPGADAIVIAAARDARVVAPLDRDPRRLQAAIAGIGSQDVEGDLERAVALAADRLRSLGGRRRIVLVTDGALAQHEPLLAAGIPTEVVPVGDDEDNAAIVRVDVRSGADGATQREQVQVFAMIQSFGDHPRDAYVTLTLEGRADPVASRRLRLGPGDKQPVLLTFEPRPQDRGQGLTVQLAPGDAMPVDDVAFGEVPASPRMPVVVASDAPYSWTTRAIEADPNVDLRRLTIPQLASVNVDPDALVVVEGACPATLPGHDAFVVGPPRGTCLGMGVGAPVDDPLVTSWETGDPRLRFLTFDGVHVVRALALEPHGAGSSLVRSTATTLVADASLPGRTVTVVGFDVGESDWPLKASFVLFVRNVLEVARLHRAQGAAGPVRTGDPVRVTVPPNTTRILVEGPAMPEREFAARDDVAVLPPLEHAGLYHARWTEPHVGRALIAANLTSARESDARPRAVVVQGSASSVAATAARPVEAQDEVAKWLALLAALALAVDVWWMTRQPRTPRRGVVA